MRITIKNIFLFFVVVFFAFLFSTCTKGNKESGRGNYITIKGSDTMVHLVSSWSESFMKENKSTEVSVTGGGSGTGIAALINGTTDICAASRSMSEKEIKLAEEKGIKPQEIIVALDGIAVVVNPSNPVGTLTIEQLKKIFRGASTRWNQFGGPDENIMVLSRESSSGTYVFFQEHVLQKEDYGTSVRLMPATSAIIQAVSTDKASIGYVGLGYALEAGDKVKVIHVKANDSSPAIIPSEETVKNSTYPIARPLFLYVKDTMSDLVKKFIDFTLSEAGQKIVKDAGYITK